MWMTTHPTYRHAFSIVQSVNTTQCNASLHCKSLLISQSDFRNYRRVKSSCVRFQKPLSLFPLSPVFQTPTSSTLVRCHGWGSSRWEPRGITTFTARWPFTPCSTRCPAGMHVSIVVSIHASPTLSDRECLFEIQNRAHCVPSTCAPISHTLFWLRSIPRSDNQLIILLQRALLI